VLGANKEKKDKFADAFIQSCQDNGVDTTKLRIIDVVCGSIIVLFQTFDTAVTDMIEQTVESEAFEVEIEGTVLSASAFGAVGMSACPRAYHAHLAQGTLTPTLSSLERRSASASFSSWSSSPSSSSSASATAAATTLWYVCLTPLLPASPSKVPVNTSAVQQGQAW
jgi:hypothetical protein